MTSIVTDTGAQSLLEKESVSFLKEKNTQSSQPS